MMFKGGVVLSYSVSREMWIAASIVESVLNEYIITTVITSAMDGVHSSPASYHYKGDALDFRTTTWPEDKKIEILDRIRNLLLNISPLYRAILEPDHLHVQFNRREIVS